MNIELFSMIYFKSYKVYEIVVKFYVFYISIKNYFMSIYTAFVILFYILLYFIDIYCYLKTFTPLALINLSQRFVNFQTIANPPFYFFKIML